MSYQERSLLYICKYSDCFADDGDGQGSPHDVILDVQDAGVGESTEALEYICTPPITGQDWNLRTAWGPEYWDTVSRVYQEQRASYQLDPDD